MFITFGIDPGLKQLKEACEPCRFWLIVDIIYTRYADASGIMCSRVLRSE